MVTIGDFVLPDISVDYSTYLTEMEDCKTCPLFVRNFAEENTSKFMNFSANFGLF